MRGGESGVNALRSRETVVAALAAVAQADGGRASPATAQAAPTVEITVRAMATRGGDRPDTQAG